MNLKIERIFILVFCYIYSKSYCGGKGFWSIFCVFFYIKKLLKSDILFLRDYRDGKGYYNKFNRYSDDDFFYIVV